MEWSKESTLPSHRFPSSSQPSNSEQFESRSPADPNDLLGIFQNANEDQIDEAVFRARSAFPAWNAAGMESRAGIIQRFAKLAKARQGELAQLIAREVGKAIWDARAEAALIASKVELSLNEGMHWVKTIEAGPGANASFHPRGVLAVLGPFNFPAHLPNGHIVPSLLLGNTILFKPSEQAPAVATWMLDRWLEAGLPEDVLQVVNGAGQCGAMLATHRDVDGVLFTGSYQVGRQLQASLLDQADKILALEMGGKNAIIVLDDADMNLALHESVLSIAVTTGQRCTCTSRIFVERSCIDRFSIELKNRLSRLRIGSPLNESTFMGPLASIKAWEHFQQGRIQASEAGGERLLGGRILPAPFVAPGIVRFNELNQNHPYQREELFGPEAAIYPVANLEEAISAVNDSDYGLAAAIFTQQESNYAACVGEIRTGILNWNRCTTGASGKLPFGGLGRSGNDRPAGITASLYASFPQAHLENAEGSMSATPPGMNLDE